MKYELSISTTNNDVINSEKDGEYCWICGTEYGVTWEESLEEFFRDNNILVEDVNYIKIPEINNDCLIDNADYGEKLGDAIITQNNKRFTVPIFCGKEGCSVYNETFDFNEIKEI